MNNKLFERLKQEASYLDNIGQIEVNPSWQAVDLKKFAQLIARECANLVEMDARTQLFTNKEHQRGYSDGRSDSAYMIKHQFQLSESTSS